MTSQSLIEHNAGLPGMETAGAQALVKSFTDALKRDDRGRWTLPRLPEKDERAAILKWREEVFRQTRPIMDSVAEKQRVSDELLTFFASYPQLRNDDVTTRIAVYMQDMLDLPMVALVSAIKAIRGNKVKGLDPDYVPTAARIVKEACEFAVALRASIHNIDKVLAVAQLEQRGPSPEQMERVNKHMAELAVALGNSDEETRREKAKKFYAEQQERHERVLISEYEHHGEIPHRNKHGVLLSRSLAVQLNIRIEKAAKGARR